MDRRQDVRRYFGGLQDRICKELEQLDGQAVFGREVWDYSPGHAIGEGGGITRVISDGAVFEKGGVNLSEVSGVLSDKLAERMKTDARRFYATGVSLVLHPISPRVPTVHMNVRYLEMLDDEAREVKRSWFGGGADLTPYYLEEEDAVHFHRRFKQACDDHAPEYYPRFKQWCDEYFFLKHRGEARGIGGLFFDYLDQDHDATFAFVCDVGDAFVEAYAPIVERRRGESWSAEQSEWQAIRRGRYVEFNLVWDRGTLFGLETGGRTESILMSMPPTARWAYDHRPEAGSPEAKLIEVLREPREWAD